ncbi:DNA double-strand break repair ATPase Rad50 [Halocatena halophila]|uniref:DNA double-strand break repair ATPase Rad50 n=1 Tax=Halocatena halophila TaxID=2814576 RepID=UPI002ED3CBFE
MTIAFSRIALENFKCYESIDVRLDDGVTVIHGLNGSGKSSLLEACFFALYGSRALDGTLDEIVTIGTETTTVELWFTHENSSYHIERKITMSDDAARTARCVLTPQAPSEAVIERPIEGATDVRSEISGLLRMDAEAFVNCAYVRQGEVNKLINASPSQRQDMIDELLQLGRLEDYRERASDARVGVGRIRDEKRGALSSLDERIEAIEEKNLHEVRNTLISKRNKRDEQIETVESAIEEAKTNRENALETLRAAKERREELASLSESIESLESTIAETERKRKTLAETLETERNTRTNGQETLTELFAESEIDGDRDELSLDRIDNRLETIAERDETLLEEIQQHQLEAQERTNLAEQLEDDADERETLASEARENASERKAAIEERREQIESRTEKLESLTERREELVETFSSAPCEYGDATEFHASVRESLTTLRERIAEAKSDKNSAKEALAEAKSLRDAGNCPECGQPVSGSPHVEAIDARAERLEECVETLETLREKRSSVEQQLETAETLVEREQTIDELDSEIETTRQLLESDQSTLEEGRERIKELDQTAVEHEATAEEKREGAAQAREQATEIRASIGEVNAERTELADRRERLERLRTVLESIESATEEIDRLETRREELAELNDERRERLTEQRRERAELQAQFDRDTLETAAKQRDDAAEKIETLRPQLEELQDSRDGIQERLGGIQNELETLETLQSRRDDVEATVDELSTLYDETERLQSMYAELRTELRQQNITRLERLINETFDVIYQNDSYAHIELDGRYGLSIYQKDGDELDPQQLSGGERALFNLSLRCGIYRLLAEGIDGTAPMPPLILDEPTVFLDSGHVTRLVDLIDSMRGLGVEQIVVVSHDDELVGAADDLINVQKDSTTNRSSIRRQSIGSITT